MPALARHTPPARSVPARVRTALAALAALPTLAAATPARAVTITQVPLAGAPAAFVTSNAAGVFVGGVGSTRAYATIASPSTVGLTPGPAGALAEAGLTLGPDGAVWYLGSFALATPEGRRGFSAIYEDTASGVLERARFASSGDAPVAMATGSDGSLWMADIGEGDAIDRYTPGGSIVRYRTIGAPIEIVAGPDGALWFTQAAPCAAYDGPCVGRITTAGEISDYPLPLSSEAYGITVGADGALWLAEWQSGTIGRMTLDGALTQYPIPRPVDPAPGLGSVMPQHLTAGPDGAIWFTDPGDDSIGRVSAAGAVTEYPIAALPPSQRLLPTVTQAGPDTIASGPGGVLWVSETAARAIARVDPAGVSPHPVSASLRACPRPPPSRSRRSSPRRSSARSRRRWSTTLRCASSSWSRSRCRTRTPVASRCRA